MKSLVVDKPYFKVFAASSAVLYANSYAFLGGAISVNSILFALK